MESNCPSCGVAFAGDWCHRCGERRLTGDDQRITTFLRSGLAEVLDWRGRLWSTLRDLAFAPGLLTDDYLAGRRQPRWSPVRLFLLVNVVYFLVQPITGFRTFNTPLDSHLQQQFYSGLLPLSSWVDARRELLEMSDATFRQLFNARVELLSRSLVFLLVPLMAMGVALARLGLRGPPLRDLVFATHFQAFFLFWVGAVFLTAWVLLLKLSWALSAAVAGTDVPTLVASTPGWLLGAIALANEHVSLLLVGAWLYIGLRRAYAASVGSALVRALLLTAWAVLTMVSYRLALFFVTLYSLSGA